MIESKPFISKKTNSDTIKASKLTSPADPAPFSFHPSELVETKPFSAQKTNTGTITASEVPSPAVPAPFNFPPTEMVEIKPFGTQKTNSGTFTASPLSSPASGAPFNIPPTSMIENEPYSSEMTSPGTFMETALPSPVYPPPFSCPSLTMIGGIPYSAGIPQNDTFLASPLPSSAFGAPLIFPPNPMIGGIPYMTEKDGTKQPRSSYTKPQLAALEKAFSNNRFPHRTDIANIALQLDTTSKRIKTWFVNRRRKFRQHEKWEQELKEIRARQIVPIRSGSPICRPPRFSAPKSYETLQWGALMSALPISAPANVPTSANISNSDNSWRKDRSTLSTSLYPTAPVANPPINVPASLPNYEQCLQLLGYNINHQLLTLPPNQYPLPTLPPNQYPLPTLPPNQYVFPNGPF